MSIKNKIILGTLSPFFIKNEKVFLYNFFKNLTEQGLKRIDTSPTYSQGKTQEILGQLLSSGISCEITTKVFADVNKSGQAGLNKNNIINSLNYSLNSLNLKKVDRLLMHDFDENVSLFDLSETIKYLFEKNFIMKIGFCKWNYEKIYEILNILNLNKNKFFVQYPYSFLNKRYEKDLIFCKQKGLETEVYGIFAQGALLGNFNKHEDEINHSKKHHIKDPKAHFEYKKLKKLFNEKDLIAENIIYRILDNYFIDNVIIGFSKPEQIKGIMKNL